MVAATPKAPSSKVPRTIWTRLHLVVSIVVLGPVTAIMATCLIISYAFRPSIKLFSDWMRVWARLILGFTRIKLTVENRGVIDLSRPNVYVVNHQNSLDIITTAAGIPQPFAYTAKDELRTWPIVGHVLRHTACLFVDRSSARRALESYRETGRKIREGIPVLLFPEGQRSYTPELLPFMRGAFLLAIEAGVPLVPVTLAGNTSVLDEPGKRLRPGRVKLILGDPIPTDGLTKKDASHLMEAVRQVMSNELRAEV
jgi:1-acyl-sn-glycerol-3-phosphate acyltransferase